jgi:hypothetical protein
MIWLLLHPLPPFSRQQVLPSFSVFSCFAAEELSDGRGWEGVREEPNHATARKPVLNKPFNTLWGNVWRRRWSTDHTVLVFLNNLWGIGTE